MPPIFPYLHQNSIWNLNFWEDLILCGSCHENIPKSDRSNTGHSLCFLNDHRSSISHKFKIILCRLIFWEIHCKKMTFKYSNFDIPGVRENVAFVVLKCWLRIAATGDAKDKWNLEIVVSLSSVAHKWPVKNHCH